MSEKKKKGRFCVAPFVALNTRGHGNMRVCCSILKNLSGIPKNMSVDENNALYDENTGQFIFEDKFYNLTQDSIEEIWNSRFYKDFRSKMTSGEYISNCEYCYDMEDNGLSSKRMGRNLQFLGNFEGDYKNVDQKVPLYKETADLIDRAAKNQGEVLISPQWLEVRFSTICNLRCVMCSPSLSTSIVREFEKNEDLLCERQKGSLRIAQKYAEKGQLRDSQFFMEQIKKIAKTSRFFEFRGGEALQDKKMMD
ncbi:MAG: SPASM domain-containing protein, partial [Pseudomonadota bacterium]